MTTKLTKSEQQELLKWVKMGIGFIEANVPEKKVNVNDWPNLDLSKVNYEQEIQTGKYDNGIALRCGRTFYGKYLVGLDFDDWSTMASWFRSKESIKLLANETLIEWHEDWGSIHVLLLTDEPLVSRKIAINEGQIEVKCTGSLLFSSPSRHTDGNKWQAIGKARSPKLLTPLETTRLKIKIDAFCNDYVSSADKERYQQYLENPGTVLGVRQGRHDATLFIAMRYYWAYKDGWLNLDDQERYNRVLEWHKLHCKPSRDIKEIGLIWRWIIDKQSTRRNEWFARIFREVQEKAEIWRKARQNEALLQEEIKKQAPNIQTLTVSEALRLLPSIGESSTPLVKVKGMISSYKELHVMVTGWTAVCPFCRKVAHETFEKPLFFAPDIWNPQCENINAPEHPAEFNSASETDKKNVFVDDSGNKFNIVFDKDGKVKRSRVYLKVNYDFIDAVEVDLQDMDKTEEITTLKTILFGKYTEGVRLGENVTTTGKIWIEALSSARDARLHKRLYAHSIEYIERKELVLTPQDKHFIECFVKKHGNNTVNKLAEYFATDIIGNEHVKKGLLLCAASCGDDTERIKNRKGRVRIHGFIIGPTGLAKSPLLRRIVNLVPGSIYESMQNTSSKSLVVIIEPGDSPIVRLGPAVLAKNKILAANELGRTSGEDDLSPLLDIQEEGSTAANKYGRRLARIHAPTTVIGSANPKVERDDNTGAEYFNINDMGIIRPIMDRFDLVFVMKMERSLEYLKKYNILKNRLENGSALNYDSYLQKHLLYCQRIFPRVSDEAMIILSDYYTNVAVRTGTPRLRERLFRCVRMVARLKLKEEADDKDAIEACELMNRLLQDTQEIANIPASPKDHTFSELLFKLEAHKQAILFEELVAKVCFTDEYINSYIGPNFKLRDNRKLQVLEKMLLSHPQVLKVQIKPLIVQWKNAHPLDCTCDRCDTCDTQNQTPPFQNKKSESQEPQKNVNEKEGGTFSVSHRSHRSHKTDNGKQKKARTWTCDYCTIIDRIENNTKKKTVFDTLTEYEKHFMATHRGLSFDPEAKDLRRFKAMKKKAFDDKKEVQK